MTAFQPLRDKLKALPVHSIISDVVKDVHDGKVTVLAAPTGSGKSMMLPSALADASDEQVVVMVPRRFLATDAAYNVAELSGTKLGQEVGFALGQVNAEKSLHTPSTKLLFCTYGYALRSGLISMARTIVLDEVHEGDEHISLARAVLHARKKNDSTLCILEMSATVNASAQASYWKDVARTSVHHAESKKHACELRHESPMRAGNKGRTIEQVVVGLLQGEEGSHRLPSTSEDTTASSREDFARLLDEPHSAGRNGIAVFRGGIKEVENTVIEIKRLLKDIHRVEVVGIHGSTPSDERRAARLPPKPGWRKIIVGTNVIESGVNLLWVDAGVSDGVRKVPHHRADTGANTLVSQELPQTGITQQMGRINRNPEATQFAKGIFILHAKNSFVQRPEQSGPAIERESMLAPAFHAASLGYNPTALKWDIGTLHASGLPARLEQARQELLRLELIHDDWSLSDQGEFINHLPVSPETGAMLNEAHRIDEQRLRSGKPARVLRDAVILAAISEGRNLKINSKHNHRGDQHCTSDSIDAMNAYRAIVAQASQSEILAPVLRKNDENYLATATQDQLAKLQGQRAKLEQLCTKHNMTVQGFIQTAQLVAEISSRLEKYDGVKLHAPVTDEKYDAARYDELKRCILNGRVNQLFQFEQGGLRDLLRDYGNGRSDKGLPFSGYEIAESSIVNSRPPEGTLVVGDLREVLPKGKAGKLPDDASLSKKKRKNACDEAAGPLLVVSNATVIPPHVFIAWAKDRAERSTSLDSIVADGHLSPDGKLHAKYAGKAHFELPVPHTAMIDAGYLLAKHQGSYFSDSDRNNSKRKKGNKGGPWVDEVRASKEKVWQVK